MLGSIIISSSILLLGVGYYFFIHKPREKKRMENDPKTKFVNNEPYTTTNSLSLAHHINASEKEQYKDTYHQEKEKNNTNTTNYNTYEQNNQQKNINNEQHITKYETINEVRNIKTIVEYADDEKLSIKHLYMYFVQDLSEQGKKDALELPDRFRIDAGKNMIRQKTIVFVDRIIRNYDRRIEEHEYHYNFNNKIGTEDTADEIATLKKILMEERAVAEKFRRDLIENTNESGHLIQNYMILEHSYLNGFMSTIASLSMLKLGYNDYNKIK